MRIKLTTSDLRTLIRGDIIELKGRSGVTLDGPDAPEQAQKLCGILQAHASSGLIFDLDSYDDATDTFTLTETS